MVHTFKVGDTVKNFGVTAKVVALFSRADDPTHPHAGHPVLREVGANGRLRGGKWVADPFKCELPGAVVKNGEVVQVNGADPNDTVKCDKCGRDFKVKHQFCVCRG